VEKPNRREFLYYLGGASLALLGMGSIGLLARFLNPPLHEGIESGIFAVDLARIPQVGEWPVAFPNGRFWLVNTDKGLQALYGVCTFREGDLPKWVPTNNRYECPRCGSKFRLDGTYIEGPAQRALDRFVIEVTTSGSVIRTPEDGSPVSIEGATQILVDTNRLIYGQQRTG
jgi:nitrite reductase/ring-hydroxylating ferredoxin subunit